MPDEIRETLPRLHDLVRQTYTAPRLCPSGISKLLRPV